MQLTTNLSDPLLELVHSYQAPIDGVEVGPWFRVQQIRDYRQMLPQLPFYFHGGDLIDRVGLIPGAVSRIVAYLHCTESPWVSMHITLWLPGMVWLMLRRGWRMPLPNPERATQRFIRQVRGLARSIEVPVVLENTEPLPFDGYDFEVRTERITQVIEGTECGFVLDIAHARVSAAVLGVDVYEYLSGLPLHRVLQVHVSGPRMRQGHLVDVHESLQETDYALLDFVLERAQPQVVTLEYIRTREALQEQLFRLRGILDSHKASQTKHLPAFERGAR
jgi:uncharacterized protein (UPF0276 family)